MKLIYSLFFLFISLSITGCGGSSTPSIPVKKEPIPAWVNSIPPNDTDTQMFGIGIGKNREVAIKAALSDMVAKLGTTVESSFESIEKDVHSYYSTSSTSNIKSSVSKIKINNYKVIKSFRISYKEFAVMVETNKQKFISGLKDNLAEKKRLIQQRYDSLRDSDALIKYNVKKDLAKQATELLPLVLILSEVDKSFDKKLNMNFISLKQKQFILESNNLKFYVSHDKKSKIFAKKIKNYLSQKGFNVSNSKKDSVNIKLSVHDNLSRGKINIVVLTLNIDVFDKAKRIGGKSIILKERYNSLASVYKNASIHFEQDISSKGINKVIGINLDID